MPTKVPEYMISGAPILVFAHESTALYKYASRYNWAFTVHENNTEKLAAALKYIISHPEERKQTAFRAIALAEKNHEKTKVKAQFQAVLINSVSSGNKET